MKTPARLELDTLIARFRDAGLVPSLSTNGGDPAADIQIAKGEKPGDVVDCWITARGERRLRR